MNIEVKIIKELPIDQIDQFKDDIVYNVAVETREYAKNSKAFPYLTGKLEREEIAARVMGSDGNYSLSAGVDYAVRLYKLPSANWTNPSTQPQWYHSVFYKNKEMILAQSVVKALKGL